MALPALIMECREQVAELCRGAYVRRLDVFGSAARGDFSVATSDLDFLVEFGPISSKTYAESYLMLKEGLERLFQRPVDLVTTSALANPYFRARVESERQVVYVICGNRDR